MANDAEEQLVRLRDQSRLEQKLEEAAAAYRKDKSEKNLRAHDRAAVALAEHRASGRTAGGLTVGGDAKAKGGE